VGKSSEFMIKFGSVAIERWKRTEQFCTTKKNICAELPSTTSSPTIHLKKAQNKFSFLFPRTNTLTQTWITNTPILNTVERLFFFSNRAMMLILLCIEFKKIVEIILEIIHRFQQFKCSLTKFPIPSKIR
jgi:hypothetical protein